jgi:hypothetical protein
MSQRTTSMVARPGAATDVCCIVALNLFFPLAMRWCEAVVRPRRRRFGPCKRLVVDVLVWVQAEGLALQLLTSTPPARKDDKGETDMDAAAAMLSSLRTLLAARGTMLDRAVELIDRKRVVRVTSRVCGRAAFQVASERGAAYVCHIAPASTCSCQDFIFSVVRGPKDAVFVRAAARAVRRCFPGLPC